MTFSLEEVRTQAAIPTNPYATGKMPRIMRRGWCSIRRKKPTSS